VVQGGIDAVHENNQRKAQTVYNAVAKSDGFYQNPVDPAAQSLMNVPFTIPSNADLEKEFISKAAAAGLVRQSDTDKAMTCFALCDAIHTEDSPCHIEQQVSACNNGAAVHRAGAAEGAPLSWRHAGFHIQLHAAGGCSGIS
jgi:hypothetical protein